MLILIMPISIIISLPRSFDILVLYYSTLGLFLGSKHVKNYYFSQINLREVRKVKVLATWLWWCLGNEALYNTYHG